MTHGQTTHTEDNMAHEQTTRYRVTCEDGATRHPAAFGSREDAAQFAEWGHACTSRHTITEDDGPRPAAIVCRTSRVIVHYADTIPAHPSRGVLLADVWRTTDTDHPSGLGAARDGAPFVIGRTGGDARAVIVHGAPAPVYRVAHGQRVTITRDDNRDVWTIHDGRGVATLYGPAVVVAPIPREDGPHGPHGRSTEDYARCVVCGDPVDYCHGHGPTGDPYGWAIVSAHDDGDHTRCHPAGCDDAAAAS